MLNKKKLQKIIRGINFYSRSISIKIYIPVYDNKFSVILVLAIVNFHDSIAIPYPVAVFDSVQKT